MSSQTVLPTELRVEDTVIASIIGPMEFKSSCFTSLNIMVGLVHVPVVHEQVYYVHCCGQALLEFLVSLNWPDCCH